MPTTKAILLYTRRRYDPLSGWKGNIVSRVQIIIWGFTCGACESEPEADWLDVILSTFILNSEVTPQSLDTTREDLGPVVLALITKKAMKELLGPEPVDDKVKECLCRLLLDPTQSLPSPPSSTWEPANRTHMWESLGKVVLQHERTDKLGRKYLELVDKLSQSNESMIYWKAAFHHNFKQWLAICLFTAYRPDNFKAVFSRIWVNNGDEAGYKALCMEWDKFRALRRGAGQQLSITELISILEGLPGPDANSNSEESYQESQILKKLLDHMQTSNPDDTEASEGARGRVGQMEGSSSMM
ncbi:hypothetical protein B0H14DRAFT_2568948 [Mycena olivaceomarginata]|nr:hypothetical protein B0H14DRAFT_2568948 [Mycena olivaceomarginata]